MKSFPKKTKAAYQPRFINGNANSLNSQFAQATEKQKEQLTITANTPASWMNTDGTKNHEAYDDFLEQREKDMWATKSL